MSDRRLAALLAAAAALFYLCFHSYFYNFDGVACAIAVELGDLRHLVHGNHLAYGVLGWGFFKLWTLLGYRGPALLSLQVLDSLLGAATAGSFFLALRRAEVRRPAALAAAAGLSFSYGFWLWSLEAQVYLLGLLAMAWFLGELLCDRPRPGRLGMLQGLAMLGHAGHLMAAPAAAYALWRAAGRERARALRRWAACAAATLGCAYALAAAFCVKPDSWRQLKLWLLGSAALNHRRAFAWHGRYYSWAGLRQWAAMSARIVSDFSPLAGPQGWAALALGLGLLGAAALGAWRARRGARAVQTRLCLLWLAGYAALYLSWEPFTMVYRLSDLLPLWFLAAVAFESAPWAGAALAAALGLVNGISGILPKTKPSSNPEYREALWLKGQVPPDAWVVVTGNDQVYVPYFAHRKPLNLFYWEPRPQALPAELDELRASGQRIFVPARVLDEAWRRRLASYGLVERGRFDGSLLYEAIGTSGKPSGRMRKRLSRAAATKKGPKGMGSERRKRPAASRLKP